MKIKSLLMSVALSLVCISAQAMNPKAVVFSVEEIVSIIKNGKASASKLIDAEFYRSSATKHALLGSIKRAGKNDIDVLISRVKGEEGIDVLRVHLVTPMDPSVKQAIDDLPMTYLMHSDIGEVGKSALVNSGVREEGMKIWNSLKESGLVSHNGDWIHEIVERIRAVRASGMEVNPPKGVLLDETMERQTYNGAIESLDLNYIPKFANGGPAAAFEIRLGITEQTTPEQLRRVLQIISNSAE